MPPDNESEKRKIMPVTTSSREIIQNIALGVLEKNNIRKPPVIAADLARTLGFKVLCAKISPECVAGFIDVDNREIVVNREDAPVKQNFTIAHELGHYLLDHYKNDNYKDNYSVLLRDTCEGEDTQMEQEASWFAESLLIPIDFLVKRIVKYPFVTNQQLARMFGVPSALIRRKATKIRRSVINMGGGYNYTVSFFNLFSFILRSSFVSLKFSISSCIS